MYERVTASWKNGGTVHNPLMTGGRKSGLNSDRAGERSRQHVSERTKVTV
jgi:hypothetical protein